MNPRLKKFLLVALAAVLLAGVSQVQDALNHDRETLGLTRAQPLENAPPVLAFTTVALGGFRGLISNLLWARAADLQEEDKFFEMAQLADWITKLEPHYTQVWIFEAWNMGWNISVKFKDFADRWRWVRRGMELLRDDALRYNPDEILLYRELAWFFQDKMGKNTDDASLYYKRQWAGEMARVFGNKPANLDELANPVSEDQKARARLLRVEFKMDPRFMKEVNERYGPLEWRLPEAHAIYWAAVGLQKAADYPARVNQKDLITLRRVIYQSMLLSFQRGRLETDPFSKSFEFGPNLDIIPKVNEAYERNLDEDDIYTEDIQRAHRYFLMQAVYALYVNNRIPEAGQWFKYLGEKYPNKALLGDPDSLPGRLTLDQFAVASVQEDVNDTSHDRVKSAVEGLLATSYRNLALDQDDRATGLKRLALKIYQNYTNKIPKGREEAMGLGPFEVINKEVLSRLLDPERGFPPQARAVLRTKLGLPAESAPAKAEGTPAQDTLPR
ncbi:MAG: hypothetical protein ABSA69_01035 [Verrucomicrobiota bacterium]|jgi:hypothetical protein